MQAYSSAVEDKIDKSIAAKCVTIGPRTGKAARKLILEKIGFFAENKVILSLNVAPQSQMDTWQLLRSSGPLLQLFANGGNGVSRKTFVRDHYRWVPLCTEQTCSTVKTLEFLRYEKPLEKTFFTSLSLNYLGKTPRLPQRFGAAKFSFDFPSAGDLKHRSHSPALTVMKFYEKKLFFSTFSKFQEKFSGKKQWRQTALCYCRLITRQQVIQSNQCFRRLQW